jgi:hypothetical protein
MTVQATTARVDYSGNGATKTFAVPFYFLLDSDISLILQDNSGYPPVVTTLAIGTDYTVTGAGVSSGGSVTLTVAPTSTQRLTILRDVDLTQLNEYVPNGPFPASGQEQALDKLTMQVQQMQEQLNRCLKFPSPDTDAAILLSAAERAGKVLTFDINGSPSLVPVAAGSGIPGSQTAVGTVDGSNTTFTFAASTAAQPVPLVYAGGIFQTQGPDYSLPTLVGGLWQIVFLTAPTNGPITIVLLA